MPIDYKNYPPNWLSEIRPRIMKRANNQCELCGLAHGKEVYAIKLDVRNEQGRYNKRSLWFSRKGDAVRESGHTDRVKPVKVVLTIAHLDHDETNHDVKDDRLSALCQLCHLRYDAKEKFKRRNPTMF